MRCVAFATRLAWEAEDCPCAHKAHPQPRRFGATRCAFYERRRVWSSYCAIRRGCRTAVVNAVASPDLQEGLRKIGSEPVSSSSEQMTQRLRNDTTTLTKIVKAAGITGEQ